MAHPENPMMRTALGRCKTELANIHKRNIPGVSPAAERTLRGLRTGIVAVAYADFIPGITDFTLVRESPDPRKVPTPILVLNPVLMTFSSIRTVQADLVRTASLVAQYPDEGYEDRYVDSYDRALTAQAKWLGNDAPIENDPRNQTPQERDELIREFLGDPRYFSDFSLADWRAAITDQQGRARYTGRRLSGLRSVETFINAREDVIGPNYTVVKLGGDVIPNLDADVRAAVAARVALSMKLEELPEN